MQIYDNGFSNIHITLNRSFKTYAHTQLERLQTAYNTGHAHKSTVEKKNQVNITGNTAFPSSIHTVTYNYFFTNPHPSFFFTPCVWGEGGIHLIGTPVSSYCRRQPYIQEPPIANVSPQRLVQHPGGRPLGAPHHLEHVPVGGEHGDAVLPVVGHVHVVLPVDAHAADVLELVPPLPEGTKLTQEHSVGREHLDAVVVDVGDVDVLRAVEGHVPREDKLAVRGTAAAKRAQEGEVSVEHLHGRGGSFCRTRTLRQPC